ncbi:uncharacterized protein EI97DRAFT_231583 [Westerdykella ornata]|uniref:Uncharacterized protein n=1 Tax=Westerdykella ornata TaxID=318751 RepID=A0A6A6J811_WESOR|nr:uncharacterized protein EI97DRAFT_231583 [Westerdykella ornata]KAF2272334.1 hypothetical protein EI97DRAFT_231583 [Westerdykella ornata]
MDLPASTIHLRNALSSVSGGPRRTYIIYFVTGNPGLIEYYRPFLTHLFGLLHSSPSPSSPAIDYEIYGRSLWGFEIERGPRKKEAEAENDYSLSGVTSTGGKPPYTVREQVELSKAALKRVVAAARASGNPDVRVILMGHSMGTYISLEVMRRLRAEAEAQIDAKNDSIRVAGAALLFATIMHLAKSSSGRKMSPFLALPHFALVVSFVARILTVFVPTTFLAMIIQRIVGFPPAPARVTAEFVKSRRGVEQALFMANDEMKEITIDKWDADIWGAAHASPHPHPRPTLRFLFAKSDHWVADETREELIRLRGSQRNGSPDWLPRMEVDESEGWPHGFCIRHSIPVAERVCSYVRDIVERDLGAS